jgi:DNA-binding NtrC family response regulator
LSASKPHILVVDDEPNVLVTYRLILQQQGYDVSAAISSEEARSQLQQGGVDLLLCDLSLEKQQSGFDVIHFGRDLNPTLQAVLLTGYASVEANDRAEHENIPVLFKPIDIQQLLQMISELLRKNNESSQAQGH